MAQAQEVECTVLEAAQSFANTKLMEYGILSAADPELAAIEAAKWNTGDAKVATMSLEEGEEYADYVVKQLCAHPDPGLPLAMIEETLRGLAKKPAGSARAHGSCAFGGLAWMVRTLRTRFPERTDLIAEAERLCAC